MPEDVGYRNLQGFQFPADATDEEIAAFLQEDQRDVPEGTKFGDFPGGNPFEQGSITTNLPFASATGMHLPIQTSGPQEARDVAAGIKSASGTAAVVGPAIANPREALKGLAYGAAGHLGGSLLGHGAGAALETAGYPEGTQDMLRRGGGTAGALIGPFKGPGIARTLFEGGLKNVPLSRTGIITRILRALGGGADEAAEAAGAGGAVEAGVGGAASDPLFSLAAKMARDKTFKTTEEAMTFLRNLNPEQAAAVARQSGAPTAGASISRQVSAARPGASAAPTGAIPQQVDTARRAASLPGAADDLAGAGSAFDATAASTARAAPLRAEIGSERAARQLGMSRGQVQRDAGTILDEALGETSKIIPAKPWARIIKDMKALPPSERVAYVARAKDIKSRDQIENLRRTLEELGLLLPIGVGAGVAAQN